MLTRRRFLGSTAAASLSLVAGMRSASAQSTEQSAWPIAIFEKVFEGLTYDELADAVAQIGADGVEATIRPRGHIEPEAAADEVPKMAEAMRQRGKRIVIAATGIESVDQPHTRSLLETLNSVGVTHYRMAHYHFDLDKPIKPQMGTYRAQARDLAALNKEIGIQGLYQNHSGGNQRRGYLGALGWDAAIMLDGIASDAIGIAFDTRHLRKDTGSSWATAVAVCKPHIRSIYVKDGIWYGPRGDQYKDVPLDTGFVNDDVFDYIRKDLPPMPVCIHMEHMGYRVFEKHEIPGAIQAHQKDIAALRKWMAE